MDEGKEFTVNDPIHGMICFQPQEGSDRKKYNVIKALIETPEFQRLRRIKQLGCVDFVYPGATHTRLAHSIGVAHLVNKAMKRILDDKKFQELTDKGFLEGYKNKEQVITIVTCAGLLHDIGHGPFSHSLDRMMISGTSHEQRSQMIIENQNTGVYKVIENACSRGILPNALDKVINDMKSLIKDYDVSLIEAKSNPLLPFRDLTHGQLDCDRFDYLQRDTYYCGTPIRIDIDYIIESMLLDIPEDHNIKHYKIILKEKAIPAIEHYLVSRLLHYKQVAFNKTAMAVESLLKRLSCYLIDESYDFENEFYYDDNENNSLTFINRDDEKTLDERNLIDFLQFDDNQIINKIFQLWQKHNNDYLGYLCHCFFNRCLPKHRPQEIPSIKDTYSTLVHTFGNKEVEIDKYQKIQKKNLIFFNKTKKTSIYTKPDFSKYKEDLPSLNEDSRDIKYIIEENKKCEEAIFVRIVDYKPQIWELSERSDIAKKGIEVQQSKHLYTDKALKEEKDDIQ